MRITRGANHEEAVYRAVTLLAHAAQRRLATWLCERDVRPSRIANRRPDRNMVASGTAVAMAEAVIKPVSGMMASRSHASSARCQAAT